MNYINTLFYINLFKNKEYKNYNTIYVKLRNYLDNKLDKYSDVSFPLIFKNDGEFKYSGAVHNQPLFKNPIMYTNIQINHYGYMAKSIESKNKRNRNIPILNDQIKKDPNDSFAHFNLGTEYAALNDNETALEHYY